MTSVCDGAFVSARERRRRWRLSLRSRMPAGLACCIGGLLGVPASLGAGQLPLPAQAFEVASIRQVDTPRFRRGILSSFPGGRFEARNATVIDLIYYAYELDRHDTVESGPGWSRQTQFDISAKAPFDADSRAVRQMVQHLLADRFSLAIRIERRTRDGRALVLARQDGKLGPGLRPSALDCPAEESARQARILDGAPREENLPKQECNVQSTNGSVRYAGHSMSQFALGLSSPLREPVVDRTGVEGTFVIEMQAIPLGLPPRAEAELLASGKDFGPPFEVALTDQLGLKLERTTIEVDVIVIDRLEQPTPN